MGTQQPIPFGNDQASGLDPLGGASPVSMNVVTEVGTGAIRRRPGITAFQSAAVNSQGISGLHETVSGDIFAVAGSTPQRNIYRLSGGSALNLSSGPSSDLRGSSRPIFAETESILAIAGGREIQKILLPAASPQGATSYASSRLGGPPPNASHVIANTSRLMANDVSTFLNNTYFSNTASGSSYTGFDDWTTSLVTGFFSAAARPDPILAVHENTNEVFAFGTTSLQVFAAGPSGSDGSAQFPPVVATEFGCAAPYSVIKVDQNFAVLDHLRRFVLTDGRTNTVISDAIQRTLNEMGTVSDCFGYRILRGPFDLLVWTFPTDGRTLVFQKGAGWSEWTGYSATTNNWTAFSVTAATTRKTTGDVLVGTGTGHVGVIDLAATADLDGPAINWMAETGFISRGTQNRKHVNSVTISLRRGETTGTSEPTLLLSWRDNIGAWEPPIRISLGVTADYAESIQLYSLGDYRRRQWRLEFTGAEDVLVAAVIEDFDVLSN